MRPFSSLLVDGPGRAGARAMLYPVGFSEEDFFKKPIMGIASTWTKNSLKDFFRRSFSP